jgi:hypothetical protein
VRTTTTRSGGPGLDGLILDEFADIELEAWTEVLRPMLTDRLGRALFIGMPRSFNHLYRMWSEARLGKSDWESWQFTTIQSGNVSAEGIEAARRDLDIKVFRQELEPASRISTPVVPTTDLRRRTMSGCRSR